MADQDRKPNEGQHGRTPETERGSEGERQRPTQSGSAAGSGRQPGEDSSRDVSSQRDRSRIQDDNENTENDGDPADAQGGQGEGAQSTRQTQPR